MAVGDGSGPVRLKLAARIDRGRPAWLRHRRPRPSPVLGPFLWLADDKKSGALGGDGQKKPGRILAARFARGLSERFALLTLVIPAKADPVRCGSSIPSLAPLEYWVPLGSR